MTKLFIYGTLKRGFRAHHLIADQAFLGEVQTKPNYLLLDLGEYPGLAETGEGESVSGELWEVCQDRLAVLDAYEGSEYVRRMIWLDPSCGHPVVDAYVLEAPDWSHPPVGSQWLKQT